MAATGISMKREAAPKRSVWGLSRSSYRRLDAGIGEATLELERRRPPGGAPWVSAAERALQRAQECLYKRDIEGGWGALHATLRYLVYGMDTEELEHQRIALRNEADKVTPWRAGTMREILGDDSTPPTATKIIDAMAVRDEFSATQYHKIWMTGEQVKFVLLLCAAAVGIHIVVALLTPQWGPRLPAEWTPPRITTVLLFGLLGASLSALRGLMATNQTMRIPERVANYFTTVARLLSGTIAGLAGYAFVIEGVLPWLDTQRIHPYLSVPLLFGIAGERLVMNVVNTMTSSHN